MMEKSILLETGIYEEFQVDKSKTVGDLVKELGLEGKLYGILVNGKKVSGDYRINETDKVVILPVIAGG